VKVTVRIVTDTASDIPEHLIKQMNITVVPLYIYFGEKAYKDGVDISADELYKRLVDGPIHPTTTQPMPSDFTNIYQELSKETDEIVSIHLSSKLSGTYNSAVQGKEALKGKCKIEVIDSRVVSMGVGMIALAAARVANAGGTMKEVVEEANKNVPKIQFRAVLATLKYLLAGGRITKARATIGSLLHVKPMLTMRDGELVQAGLARSYPKGVDKLYEFVKNTKNIKEIAIVQSTVPDEADQLKERLSSVVAREKIHMARVSAALGVHGGPGILIVAVAQE
jgi:DegV family protein with EDD domain